MMIAATGNGSHAFARTALHIQTLQERIRFFLRHARHINARQRGVERLLLRRLRMPHCETQDNATDEKDQPDQHHQSESCSSIELLQLRATTPHSSLYSMRGAPQSLDNFLAAGHEFETSGRNMATNGTGWRA
jgi:hypothetical protein